MKLLPRYLIVVLVVALGIPEFAEAAGHAVPDSSAAGDPPALDLTDTSKLQRHLDTLSADQLARYLTDAKSAEYSRAFQALRTKGEVAIPHLVKLMGRDDLAMKWTDPPLALLEMGDKSLPALIDLLESDNRRAQYSAAWAMMKRNKPCKDAIKPLIHILQGKDKSAAGYAGGALAPNGKEAAEAVPYLIPLTFEIGSRTHSPVLAVQAIGLDAKLIPDVVAQVAADDGNREARSLRIELGAQLFAAAGKDGAVALAEAMRDKNLNVRLAATKGIREIGSKVRTDDLEKALNDALAEDVLRAEAAAALVAIGGSAKGAVAGLMKELESGKLVVMHGGDYEYRSRAAEVLATIPEAGPHLAEGLNSPKKIVRIGCLWALVKRAKVEEAQLYLDSPVETRPAR